MKQKTIKIIIAGVLSLIMTATVIIATGCNITEKSSSDIDNPIENDANDKPNTKRNSETQISTEVTTEKPTEPEYEECEDCYGEGESECYACYGEGTTICNACKGTKGYEIKGMDGFWMGSVYIPPIQDSFVPCSYCNGAGYSTCNKCRGSGYLKCETCNGEGEIRNIGYEDDRTVNSDIDIDYTIPTITYPTSTRESTRLCLSCNGLGRCPVCGGSGTYSFLGYSSPCSACESSGKCWNCHGEGVVPN